MGDAIWDDRAPHRRDPAPTVSPPSDYPPRLIRVTDEQDGLILNRIYSYWPNAWVSGATIDAFVGTGDGTVHFFSIDRTTGSIERHGALISYPSTGEGWYWDADGWVYLCDGPRLRRVNPFTREDTVVFDLTPLRPNCRLWQAHSSEDGQVHSATVEQIVSEGPYPRIGTVVSIRGVLSFFPAIGALDESQVSMDGRWVLIKEDDDNRVIELATGHERRITNADGALGHSDMGPHYAVGEDDQVGACVKLDLTTFDRLKLFDTWNMGHVSVRGGRCLRSDPTSLSLVDLAGGGLTHVCDHGMTGEGYDFQVHANLSPDGFVAAYVSNAPGRMDLFVVELLA